MLGYGWGGGCHCGGPGRMWPASRDQFVEELEEYKASLEWEIAALERRIKALREKA